MKKEEKLDKDAFKRRLYNFVLKLIEFIDKLTKDRVTLIIEDQLLRSGTSILSNYIEGQSASSRKEFLLFIQYCLKSTTRVRFGLHFYETQVELQKRKLIGY